MRIPLAAAFPFVVTKPVAAIAVVAASGLTDVLDGWWARRFDQTTPMGAVVDGVSDKIFVLSVAVSMLVAGLFAPWQVLLLGTRDIGEVVLMAWVAVSGGGVHAGEEHRANTLGKATTLLQFIAVTLAIFGQPAALFPIVGAGLLGVATAWSYRAQAT